MKYILMTALLLGGCKSMEERQPQRHAHFSPIPIESYDEEILKENAKALDMRYVDYLHALTNNKIPQLRAANALK